MTVRRILGRGLVVVAVVWGAYLFVANTLLMSGLLEGLMSRHPIRTATSWERAWTVIPGWAEVRGFELKGQTARNQYWLRIASGRLRVRLTALLRFHFHATSVEARGVRYWQRRQRVEGEPPPPGASLEPVIPGLPGVRPPLEQLKPPRRRFPWTIQLDRVVGEEVEEVWITAYRGRGRGQVEGDLRFEIGGDVEVPRAALVFPGLDVDTGSVRAGDDLTLEIDGRLEPGPARSQRALDFLARSHGRITVAGEVADFGFLNLMFKRVPRFRLRGAGLVGADVTLANGLPTGDSRVDFRSQRITAVLAGLEITGRGTVDITSGEGHRLHLVADIRDIGAEGLGLDTADDAVPHLEIEASSSLTDLHGAFADPRLSLTLPRSRIDDLTAFNHLLPASLPLRFLPASEATMAGWIELDEHRGAGAIHLEGDHIQGMLNRRPLVGSVALDLILDDAEADELLFDMAGSALLLRSEPGVQPPWRASVLFPEAVLALRAPLAMQGRVEVAMTDTRPLIAAFAPDRSSLLASLMAIDDIRASAELDLNPDQMAISDVEASGTGLGREILGGRGATVVLTSDAIDPMQGFRALELALDLEELRIPDLAALNRFLPATSGVRLSPGHGGIVDGHFEVADEVFSGEARIDALGVGLEVCNLRVHSDLALHLLLPAARLDERRLDLSGSRVWLGHLVPASARTRVHPPWNALVTLTRGSVELGEEVAVTADVEAWLDSTAPLIAAYLPGETTGLRLADLLNVDDVAVTAELRAGARSLTLDQLSITGRGTAAGHLRGPGFEVIGHDLTLDAARGFTSLDLTVVLPPSEITDLAAFNAYIPPTSGVRFADRSRGSISARLEVQDTLARGRARLEAEGVGLDLGQLSVVGDLTAELELREADLVAQRYDLGGSSLAVDAARAADDAGQWWARVDLPRAVFHLTRPFALDARLFLEMGDSRPLVSLVAGADRAWLAELLTFTEVTGMAAVRLDRDLLHLDEVEIRGFGRSSSGVFGSDLKVTARGEDVDLTRGVDGLAVTVDLPSSTVRDLSLFNRYLPTDAGVRLLPGGEAEVSARLELASGRAAGHFTLRGRDVGAEAWGGRAVGEVELAVPIHSGGLRHSRLDISGAALTLSGFDLDDGEGHRTEDWWARLDLPSAQVDMGSPLGLTATAELALRDSWPLTTLAAQRSWWARLLRGWITVDDIEGSSRLRLDGDGLILDDIDFRGERFGAEGRLRLADGGFHGLVLLAFRGLHGALRLDGDEHRLKLIRPRRWYERLLPTVELLPEPQPSTADAPRGEAVQ